jgi:hypothetical protein
MTSKLYEEAIADSKKLKSLLREEVEKDLIEKMKPFMEQALNSEIDSFLMEAEEETAPPAEGGEVAVEPAAPPAEGEQAAAPEQEAPAEAAPAPITPVGGQMNLPLPDESGMITVGFADLFSTPVAPAPTTTEPMVAEEPVAEPAAEVAEPPATTAQALAEAKKIVSGLENEFNSMVSKNAFGLKEKTNFTYKLVEGYAELETLKGSNLLRESTFNILANKMENLFKLSEKSNKISNSYSGTQNILEGKNMKVHPNTKSLINSLLESLETGYGKDGSSPAKYSKGVGVSRAERAGLPAKPKGVDPGRGHTAMFDHEAEVDEDLLKEVAELEEELEEMENINELEETLEEMDECGMGYDAPSHGGKGDREVVIRLVTEPGMAEMTKSVGGPAMFEADGMEEGMYEADEAYMEEEVEEGYNEGADEVYEITMDEADAPAAKPPAAKPAAPAAPAAPVAEMAALRENLASNEHLLARSILANKIFAEYDLSRKQKQLVVEYLDRAENVKDATRIYGRIKKQLVEAAASAAKSEKKAGSLNESVSRSVGQPANAANRIVIGSAERFKQLVAGNKNSQ